MVSVNMTGTYRFIYEGPDFLSFPPSSNSQSVVGISSSQSTESEGIEPNLVVTRESIYYGPNLIPDYLEDVIGMPSIGIELFRFREGNNM